MIQRVKMVTYHLGDFKVVLSMISIRCFKNLFVICNSEKNALRPKNYELFVCECFLCVVLKPTVLNLFLNMKMPST